MGNHPSKTSPPASLAAPPQHEEPGSKASSSAPDVSTSGSTSKGTAKWKNRLSNNIAKVDIKRFSGVKTGSGGEKRGAASGGAGVVGSGANANANDGKEGHGQGGASEGTAKKGAGSAVIQENGQGVPPLSSANNNNTDSASLPTPPPNATSAAIATGAAPPVVTVTEADKTHEQHQHQQPQPQQIHIKIPTPPSQQMAPAPVTTVPCQYRTGKTLGSGTYAVVKEAIHIKTGKYYACKVISKKLMEGREYMVRNEIAVLKRVSVGHRNIVTLHDYFETSHNLYLVFDLCTGGELFDRICAKGNYFEADAAALVRTILGAVEYIHSCGIVHRDLKPENLLFREKSEDADIMIADFGLSRVMEEEKLQLLTEICGTPGYMAPEIFKKSGHGKPVDVWAIGVITYFLLCGYTPFDRDTQEEETKAICRGDYKFEPEEYWQNVSQAARDFVSECLTIDPNSRPTATEALKHKWLSAESPCFVADMSGNPTNLLPTIQKGFNAKKTFRKAVLSMMAVRKMSMLTAERLSPGAQEFAKNINKYMEESEKEHIDGDKTVVHHHNAEDEEQEKRTDDISVDSGKNVSNNMLGAPDSKDKQALLSPTDMNTPATEQLKEPEVVPPKA